MRPITKDFTLRKRKKHVSLRTWIGRWSIRDTKFWNLSGVVGTVKSIRRSMLVITRLLQWSYARWPKWPKPALMFTWSTCSESARPINNWATPTLSNSMKLYSLTSPLFVWHWNTVKALNCPNTWSKKEDFKKNKPNRLCSRYSKLYITWTTSQTKR